MAETASLILAASESYRQAAETGEPDLLNSLAWLLATSASPNVRDGKGAIAYSERAVAATNHKDDGYLDTLAAAYAEAGRFAQAIVAQQEAIAIAGDASRKNEYLTRLKLYESGVPYHEKEDNE